MATSMTQTLTHTVIFQTGGSANFQWHRTLIRGSEVDVIAAAVDLERKGFPAIVISVADLERIGLPDGAAERSDEYDPPMSRVGQYYRP